MAGKRPLLSLVMIMRDAAEDLERCLTSCAEAMDEMIICDTGSVDGSVKIARRFLREWQGAKAPRKRRGKILYFEWCDDFAAARNFALKHAKGEWALALDTDERLTEETRRNLRPLMEQVAAGQLPEGVRMAREYKDEYPETKGVPCDQLEIWRYNLDRREDTYLQAKSRDAAARLLRLTPGLHYVGEVHEQLRWTDGRMARTATVDEGILLIEHTGYMPEVDPLKTERNNRILLKEEKEGGDTLLKNFYLAEIYLEKGDYLAVVRHAEAAIKTGCPLHDMFWPWRMLYMACVKLEEQAIERHGKDSREARFAAEQTEKTLAAGIQRMSSFPEFYYYRGLRLLKAGEQEKGLEHFRICAKLVKVFPDFYPDQERHYEVLLPDLYRRLACLSAERGEREEAAEARERLAELEEKKGTGVLDESVAPAL